MSTKRQIPYNDGVYFITFTCHKWLPLFEITKGYDIVYNWFDHLKTKGHYIIGYVIMPNHVHALIGFTNSIASINTTVGNGKRFMALLLSRVSRREGMRGAGTPRMVKKVVKEKTRKEKREVSASGLREEPRKRIEEKSEAMK